MPRADKSYYQAPTALIERGVRRAFTGVGIRALVLGGTDSVGGGRPDTDVLI
jgi:hypothetical protein